MSIESSADRDGLQAVSAIVSQTLNLLTRSVEPGITTRAPLVLTRDAA